MNVRERRDHPRIPFNEDVIVYAAGRRLPCRGSDLSVGGIGLLPPEGARPGMHVIVDMGLAGLSGSESFAVEGYLVRQERRATRWSWGVRFHQLSPRAKRKLNTHIEAQRGQPTSRHLLNNTWRPPRVTPELPQHPRAASSAVASSAVASSAVASSAPASSAPASTAPSAPREGRSSLTPTPSPSARPRALRKIPTSTVSPPVMPPPLPATTPPAPAPAFDEPPTPEADERDTIALPSPVFSSALAPLPATTPPAPHALARAMSSSPPEDAPSTAPRRDNEAPPPPSRPSFEVDARHREPDDPPLELVDLPAEDFDREVALVAAADAQEALDRDLDEAFAQLYVKALHDLDDLDDLDER